MVNRTLRRVTCDCCGEVAPLSRDRTDDPLLDVRPDGWSEDEAGEVMCPACRLLDDDVFGRAVTGLIRALEERR